MEKQGTQTEHNNGSNSMDMISELPQPILHHILSFLCCEKCATQTSVLSKPWHHIWSTRPKIELCESDFPLGSKFFLSALDNVFQRYHDQNLSIQELCLEMEFDFESASVLNKWIPIVKVFNLNLSLKHSYWGCDIPLPVLLAGSLKKLLMEDGKLYHQNASSIGKFKHLQTLDLVSVIINDDEAFEKMVSSCPCLKSLTLEDVQLSNDSLNLFSSNHLPSLEYLNLHCCYGFTEFHMLSRSIKHLIIYNHWINPVEKATIHAPSILYFKYTTESKCIPSISFKTTNDHEWKSEIEIDLSFEKIDTNSSWFVKLNKLLSALRYSEISLTLNSYPWREIEDPQDDEDDTRLYRRPVMVENLNLNLRPAASFRHFIHDLLLRVCHPRKISYHESLYDVELEYKQFDEVLYAILIMEREATWQCLLRRDLEEVSVEDFKESRKRQNWTISGTHRNRICFRLKWR